jgi:hypothetical protein
MEDAADDATIIARAVARLEPAAFCSFSKSGEHVPADLFFELRFDSIRPGDSATLGLDFELCTMRWLSR